MGLFDDFVSFAKNLTEKVSSAAPFHSVRIKIKQLLSRQESIKLRMNSTRTIKVTE